VQEEDGVTRCLNCSTSVRFLSGPNRRSTIRSLTAWSLPTEYSSMASRCRGKAFVQCLRSLPQFAWSRSPCWSQHRCNQGKAIYFGLLPLCELIIVDCKQRRNRNRGSKDPNGKKAIKTGPARRNSINAPGGTPAHETTSTTIRKDRSGVGAPYPTAAQRAQQD